jgi:hypothetical protein
MSATSAAAPALGGAGPALLLRRIGSEVTLAALLLGLLLGSVEPRAYSGVDRVAEFLISVSKDLRELDCYVDIEVDGGAPTSRSGPSLDNGA